MSTDSAMLRALSLLVVAAALASAPAAAQTPSAPAKAPRAVATYRIQAELDPDSKTVTGQQTLLWRNVTSKPTSELQFHLYLNAFKNNRTTFALESGGELWEVEGEIPDDYWGHIEIDSLEREIDGKPAAGAILGSSHIQPDDGNRDDETVLRVELAEPVPPEGTLVLKMGFTSKLPRGIARTGWVDGYFFAAQWFPKIGVLEDNGWNCRQYHANTEYYADFGHYDVTVKVPSEYLVAGTGDFGRRDNQDGTTSYRFMEQGVHDFAWMASTRHSMRQIQFNEGGLPRVSLRLYLLDEHADLSNRYLVAARRALRQFSDWFGPYPYSVLSVVDPPYRSDTGGMEYPTLVTGGTRQPLPPESLSPESVTFHEVGHQWWYGMVASNETDEAWLDEGINSWAEARALKTHYPQPQYIERFFGGVPVVFPSMGIPFETLGLPSVRRFGKLAPMNQTSWTIADDRSYRVNSYTKPEVTLWTLDRFLGGDRLLEALRAYFQRHAFTHPTTDDFIAAVNESAGEDLGWFFDETFRSSELVDYAIDSARSYRIPPIAGRRPASSTEDGGQNDSGTEPSYLTEVVVRRLEGARLPVEALLVFEDGSRVTRSWNGRDRSYRIKLETPSRLLHAAVDPERKILLDIDPVNNTRLAEWREGEPSRAAAKWTSKWLFWIQNLMETFAFLG